MFLNDIATAGAIPTLEHAIRFAGQRQRLIAHNVANYSTPNFTPLDASPRDFQKALADAIGDRRGKTAGMHGELEWDETSELKRDDRGELMIEPSGQQSAILFHDRAHRDLERLMQDQAENAGVYRVSMELLRSRYQQINDAIAARV
ncbi:MAG: flagellar basal body rod protein FlgB [Phycisphaerales bacterium]